MNAYRRRKNFFFSFAGRNKMSQNRQILLLDKDFWEDTICSHQLMVTTQYIVFESHFGTHHESNQKEDFLINLVFCCVVNGNRTEQNRGALW